MEPTPGVERTSASPPIACGELVDDREPEARAHAASVPRAVVEVEALERPRQVGLGEPGTVVDDLEAAGAGEDPHRAAGGGRAQGVLDEVRERLEHAIRVADRPGVGLRQGLEPDPERACGDLVTLNGEHRELREIERLGANRERAAAEPREVEQVADEPLEASRLPLDHEPRRLRLEHAVLERLRVAADRRQRRLQLVADREQEGALGVLCLVELAREVVERARERRDLSRPRDGQRVGPLARGEGTARLGDARDGSRDGAREQERDERPRERRRRDRQARGRGRTASSRPPGSRPGGAGRSPRRRFGARHRETASRGRRPCRSRRCPLRGAPLRPRGAGARPARARGSRGAALRSRGSVRARSRRRVSEPAAAASRSGRPAARAS